MPTPGSQAAETIRTVYPALLGSYGPQGWWPVTGRRGSKPRYTGGPRNPRQRFEVAAGAVLTQNTAWTNAARAVTALSREGLLDPAALARAPQERIARLIRSSGYYNQKARRLMELAAWFAAGPDPDRGQLLRLNGIGPETADSILLYGFNLPYFVVDAYTRRIFTRLGALEGSEPYERIRALFESTLEPDPAVYNEYHALIVEHAKRRCARRPVCGGCPLDRWCISNDYY
jgi:endonuclease-3 related protein